MPRRYELVRPEEDPVDAVVVTIRCAHGLPVADVACTHCPAADEYVAADFPRPVSVALERAEELRAICQLGRVVVSLTPGASWNRGWGDLVRARQRARQAFDAPSPERWSQSA